MVTPITVVSAGYEDQEPSTWYSTTNLPSGHGTGDLLEIGDAPFRAVADQGSPPLKPGCHPWTATGLSHRRHPVLGFMPFHVIEIRGFHRGNACRNPGSKASLVDAGKTNNHCAQ
jgi:hypothetical protein